MLFCDVFVGVLSEFEVGKPTVKRRPPKLHHRKQASIVMESESSLL